MSRFSNVTLDAVERPEEEADDFDNDRDYYDHEDVVVDDEDEEDEASEPTPPKPKKQNAGEALSIHSRA